MSFPRYPEYKNSGVDWLGEAPINWSIGRLKYLLRIRGGQDYKAVESADPKDYPVIGSGGHFTYATSFLYDGESVLLGRKGTIDKPLYIRGKFWTVDTMFYTEVLPKTYGRYAYYAATTIPFSLYSTNTALPSMSQFDLANHALPLPSYQEQTQIARFLDHETAKIDTLIHEQKRLIELLKEKRQAVISHAVTKGLDPDVPMKDSGVEWLGEVPAHWSVEPLKYLCSFSGGGTPAKENLEYWNGDIPWVSPKDMKSFRISGSKDKITGLALNESSTSLVKAGALLMVVRSGILQRTIPIGINSVDVTLNQDMKALRFKNPDFAEYFAYFIKGYEPSLLIEWRKQGATVESIEQEYLGESLTLVPPLNEVAKIIEHLSHADQRYGSLQAEAKKSSAMLLERRSALISAAVTGKIDVRNWQSPADESAFDEEVRQAGMEVTV